MFAYKGMECQLHYQSLLLYANIVFNVGRFYVRQTHVNNVEYVHNGERTSLPLPNVLLNANDMGFWFMTNILCC